MQNVFLPEYLFARIWFFLGFFFSILDNPFCYDISLLWLELFGLDKNVLWIASKVAMR